MPAAVPRRLVHVTGSVHCSRLAASGPGSLDKFGCTITVGLQVHERGGLKVGGVSDT